MPLSAPEPRFHKWLVFGAVSLAFFFVNFSTFSSLGVVLFTMAKDLRWSHTAAGFTFSLLGLSCGFASPLPALTMRWIGGRPTMAIGTVLLVAGFGLASLSQSLTVFDVAVVLFGVGFTFVGNVPGVFWIAVWFERGSARVIGIYMMVGALGAAFAAPVVDAIVRAGGWRFNWQLMAILAAVVGGACLLLVGNRRPSAKEAGPAAPSRSSETGGWTTRQAFMTWQCVAIAMAHIVTMMSVTTSHSMVVSHLAKLGSSSAQASLALGAISMTAVLVKAVTGYLCEKFPAALLIAVGLVLQALGNMALAFASTPILQFVAALAFGTGWALSIVAAMVAPIDFFGSLTGPRVLSVIALLTTFGAAGPIAAGVIADRFGTFVPVFGIFAALQLAVAIPTFFMRRPIAPSAAASESLDNDMALLGAAEAI